MRRRFDHLRLVEAALLAEYLTNTWLFRKLGNAAFAERIANAGRRALVDRRIRRRVFQKTHVLYHAWKDGFLEVDASDARRARRLLQGNEPSVLPRSYQPLLAELDARGWCCDEPIDIDALAVNKPRQFTAIQNAYELATFLKRVHARSPRTVLEIGTARGGMLCCLSQVARPDALLVSIDLPGAPNCGGQTARERRVFETFVRPRQRVHFIPQSSQLHDTRERLERILDGRTLDVIFIDGDHSFGGVLADFEIYRRYLSPGGILALHDICLDPREHGVGSDVGPFWELVCRSYRTEAIVDLAGSTRRRPPPGVASAWGIGIVHVESPAPGP
jgi:predicted O-methyltransferase YrrM